MMLHDLIGQTRAVTMLERALGSGRLHHTLLFTGPSGVGKWSAAHGVAAALLCRETPREMAGRACGCCGDCRQVLGLAHPDVHYIMPIAGPASAYDPKERPATDPKKRPATDPKKRLATEKDTLIRLLADRRLNPFAHAEQEGTPSISVAWIREIQRVLALRSHGGGGRIVIVREAEAINPTAANAFLKTLEEPPEGSFLILTSAAPARLLPTVLSRAQRIPFGILDREEMSRFASVVGDRLENGGRSKEVEPLRRAFAGTSHDSLIEQSKGRPGELLERLSLGPPVYRDLAFRLLSDGIGRDVPGWIALIEKAGGTKKLNRGQCEGFFDALLPAFRDLLALQNGGRIADGEMRGAIESAANRIPREAVPKMLASIQERRRLLQEEGTRNVNPSLLMAVTLADLARGAAGA